MNRNAQYSLQLLTEFDRVCRDAQITYALGNKSAWDCWKRQSMGQNAFLIQILIPRSDFEKLQNTVLPEHRVLLVGDTKRCDARYADTNSTLFDYAHPARYKKRCPGLELFVVDTEAAKPTYVTSSKTITLRRNYFANLTSGKLESGTFPVFEDLEDYLLDAGGKKYQTSWRFRTIDATFSTFLMVGIPWSEYKKRPLSREALSFGATLYRFAYLLWEKKLRSKHKKPVDRQELMLARTEARFSLWERYYPRKDAILAAINQQGLTEEVQNELMPIVRETERFKSKGLGFSFDEAFLQAILPILEKKHGKKYVSELLEMIPKEYREESIEDILRKSDVHHPLLQAQ